jgi:hypothetical protein
MRRLIGAVKQRTYWTSPETQEADPSMEYCHSKIKTAILGNPRKMDPAYFSIYTYHVQGHFSNVQELQ